MKKISLIFLFACLLACGTKVYSQEQLKKPVLGIEQFTYSSAFTPADVEMLRNQLVRAIQNTGRVIVVDHNSSTERALDAERERRKQESAMEANEVEEMTSLNANSLFSVHLDQLSITREIYEDYEYKKGSDGKTQKVLKGKYPYYKAVITYTVKITDPQNGAVQGQETYAYSAGSYSTYSNKADYNNESEAHEGIMKRAVSPDAIKLLILNTFKAKGRILQVDEGDAKKAKTVYVNLGSGDGIQKKQTLEVYKELDIDGEVSRKLVGEIEVVEILGNSRCLAKVKKGGDIIMQVLSSGGNLPVSTREVKQKFFGGLKM
ncbi:MAG: hypothetical protein J1E38_04000 [Paramuribaculum sp.]|nr:hypothetical protein [Paramuribaculum sp.]